jgi:hypothetical protein
MRPPEAAKALSPAVGVKVAAAPAVSEPVVPPLSPPPQTVVLSVTSVEKGSEEVLALVKPYLPSTSTQTLALEEPDPKDKSRTIVIEVPDGEADKLVKDLESIQHSRNRSVNAMSADSIDATAKARGQEFRSRSSTNSAESKAASGASEANTSPMIGAAKRTSPSKSLEVAEARRGIAAKSKKTTVSSSQELTVTRDPQIAGGGRSQPVKNPKRRRIIIVISENAKG